MAPNGDVLIALRRGRGERENGGLLALRDNDGDGRADVDAVLRYPFEPGTLGPADPPDTNVSGFPPQSLYIADDKGGRIWRVYYVGE